MVPQLGDFSKYAEESPFAQSAGETRATYEGGPAKEMVANP